MKKTFKNMLVIVFILMIAIFIVRFIYGGDEDAWICSKGEWVEHGHPSSPKPVESCGDTELLR